MKQAPPTLAPLLRSDLQGELLASLFLHPDDEHTLSDLARLLKAPLTTVHSEVERLAAGGLLEERRVGRARLVRASHTHPLAPSLTELLTLTYGPVAVLPELLRGLPGLERAFLYGSWAARRLGEAGPPPQDIDVLLVGPVARRAAAKAQGAATAALRREVNLTILDPGEWARPSSGFAATVKAGPLVPIDLHEA